MIFDITALKYSQIDLEFSKDLDNHSLEIMFKEVGEDWKCFSSRALKPNNIRWIRTGSQLHCLASYYG